MNWPLTIFQIIACGLTQVQIAKRCKSNQSVISALLSGRVTNPRWPLGQALIALHAELHAERAQQRAERAEQRAVRAQQRAECAPKPVAPD